MNRIRSMAAVVTVGAALSLLGTGVASAGTGPVPGTGSSAPASGTSASETGNPRSAQATAAGVCTDAYQIGTTSYAYRGTETIASVKQFYSPTCDENYGYVWVWKSFLDKKITFDLTVGVWSFERESLVGNRTVFDTHSQEFWGNAADTTDECTSGDGAISVVGEQGQYHARSSKRC